MHDVNYWNVDLLDLPSKGTVYPEGTYFKLRPLTVGNCKYLSTLDQTSEYKSTCMLNEILSSCMKTNLEFSKLVHADRNYMLYWIRVNSFVSSNGYELDVNCPNCGSKLHKSVKLNDMDIQYYDSSRLVSHDVDLNGNLVTVEPRILTVADHMYRLDDRSASDILNYTNVSSFIPKDCDATWWIGTQDALTYAKMLDVAKRAKFGIDSIVTIGCPTCSGNIRVEVDLSDRNMFGRISLYEILKVQVQISKYCGLQITDDMSYTDVELIQEVVKETIEQEKAEYEKQKNQSIHFTRPAMPKAL